MKLEFPIFEKYSNTKFRENPFNRSEVVSGGGTGMTKLIVAFRKIAKSVSNPFEFDSHPSGNLDKSIHSFRFALPRRMEPAPQLTAPKNIYQTVRRHSP
jgi:hypothetical protein